MKILFFGDSHWSANSLVSLVENGWTITGVVLRKKTSDDSLESTAGKLGLDIYQPEKCNSEEFVRTVKMLTPDLNLSVSYDQILKKQIIDSAPKGFINFHAGKLPYYRGRNIINWAIINGEKEIGLTAHFVDEGIDTGDIILQKTIAIEWEDSYAEVLGNVTMKFPDLVSETVSLIESGQFNRKKQSHLIGTYFPKRMPGDEWIDWRDTSLNIYYKIRAISRPGPGARTVMDGKTIVVWRSTYDPEWPLYNAIPGAIVGIEEEGIRVKTGNSTIILNDCEPVESAGDHHHPLFKISTRFEPFLNSYMEKIKD